MPRELSCKRASPKIPKRASAKFVDLNDLYLDDLSEAILDGTRKEQMDFLVPRPVPCLLSTIGARVRLPW